MTDAKQPDRLSELPELPEMSEIEELPELPDAIEALPDLPDEIVPVATPAKKAERPPVPPKPKAVVKPKPAVVPKPAAAKKPAPARVAEVPAPKPAEPAPTAKAEPVAKQAPLTEVEAAPSAEPSQTAMPSLALGEKPPLRVLDKAPTHLRKAAMLVAAGSLLPWLGHGGGLLTLLVGKAMVIASAWLWLKQIDHNWGPALPGFLGKLAGINFEPKKKEEDEKKERRRKPEAQTALKHPFPTALHLLSVVLVLAGCAMPMLDAGVAQEGRAVAELGMLAWAAFTFVHIHSYERWGSFNPLFPLMFLGMLIGGIASVVGGIGDLSTASGAFSVIGGAIVAAGGGLAAYTIVEAMMEAKKDGDRKKQETIEARKKARADRKKN